MLITATGSHALTTISNNIFDQNHWSRSTTVT